MSSSLSALPHSSNSVRIVEVALAGGAKDAPLVDHAGEVDEAPLEEADTVGVSSGASVPEILAQRPWPASPCMATPRSTTSPPPKNTNASLSRSGKLRTSNNETH